MSHELIKPRFVLSSHHVLPYQGRQNCGAAERQPPTPRNARQQCGPQGRAHDLELRIASHRKLGTVSGALISSWMSVGSPGHESCPHTLISSRSATLQPLSGFSSSVQTTIEKLDSLYTKFTPLRAKKNRDIIPSKFAHVKNTGIEDEILAFHSE
jgi:hypothetical protein